MVRAGRALALLVVLSCSGATPERFCGALDDLSAGRIAIKSDPNEMRGHVSTLKALLRNAPAEIRDDLDELRKYSRGCATSGGCARCSSSRR